MKKFNFKNILKKKSPFLIAEIGVNHENSIKLAEKIIRQAKNGGADAVKFQTYKAELIASKNSPYYWDLNEVSEKSQYKLFQKFDKFNVEDYKKLKKICDKYKIIFTSTPFDLNSVDFLDDLVPFFKIASADFTNLPLIDKICSKKKPIVISTGACEMQELLFLDKYLKKKFPKIEVVFLHCVLSYPTSFKNANLNFIKILKKKFPKRIIGYSDHTLPDNSMLVLTKSVEFGAQVIEKHFTEKNLKGKKNNDHFHSMDLQDIKKFRSNIDLINKIEGKEKFRKVLKCEKSSRKNARRSLFTYGIINKGEKISYKNIIAKRPGDGISPMLISQIINKKVKRSLKDDHKLKFSDIK
tara:strand:+ start:1752 stop:2813 length:1062 start_codon:yes stop_codon:yes gene_type:complete